MNKDKHKLEEANTGKKEMKVGNSPILFFTCVEHNVTGRSDYIATHEKLSQVLLDVLYQRNH